MAITLGIQVPKKLIGLDPDKIVEYPGFNVALDKHVKDEYKYHRVPPFNEQFKKENMLDYFRKIAQAQEDDLETRDMDLDTSEILAESLPDDSSQSQDKQLQSNMDSDSNNELSISLQELQKQKDTLLEEIRKSGATVPWEDTSQSSIDDTKTEMSNKSDELPKVTVDDCVKTEISKDSGTPEIPKPNPINSLKNSTFGTPILKSSSPYDRLPDLDNFTKGVSPVIDFENLPNSTGKYEQMTGVLQKVRSALKNLSKSKT